jgi:hypothetical protein
MTRFRILVVAAALVPFVGCTWIREHLDPTRPPGPITKGTGGELPKVMPDQLVTYVNDRATRMQSLYYSDVKLTASDHNVPLPATLRGSMAANQPRNFRMTAKALAANVDLGSNSDQFWVYFDGAGARPMFVFASHSDFEAGKAKIPGGIPFEPDWVMQALGMITLPPNNQYTAPAPDQRNRTYTLSWPATTPAGVSVVKEIVFDGDPAIGSKPQVKRHLVKDTKGKLICSAEIKQAKTVQLPTADPRTGLPLSVQYPTRVVLKWEEQKFEMELDLTGAKVNEPFPEEQARRLCTRPNIAGATPIDLARYDFSGK